MKRLVEKTAPSLTGLFAPPEGFVGEAGVLCGYSADEVFLDAALTRFTSHKKVQRAVQGTPQIALILDASCPQITWDSVPGLRHLPLRPERPAFALLHAKVALLLFRSLTSNSSEKQMRLIVSTGNWTRQTAEDSIDLFWCADQDLSARPDPEVAADMTAAWDFLSWVLTKCCHVPSERDDTPMIATILRAMPPLKDAASLAGATRFFDNRQTSLLTGLLEKVKPVALAGRRNYLAVGSGFFNHVHKAVEAESEVQTILQDLWAGLASQRLLAKDSELDLFVNPRQCQGVAQAQEAIRKDGWTIRKPSYPSDPKSLRSLHAKFIFSAGGSGNQAWKPWLYLGSGNMTRQGLMMKANPGNLEAGILLRGPSRMEWQMDRRRKGVDLNVVACRLPLQWDHELDEQAGLEAGDPLKDCQPVFLAPPVDYFLWHKVESGGQLVPPDGEYVAGLSITGPDGRQCREDDGWYEWSARQPSEVHLTWPGGEGFVPVLGLNGRVNGPLLPARELPDLWEDLDGFPEPPNIDEQEDEDADMPAPMKSVGLAIDAPVSATVIRMTATLIERIAAKQCALAEHDWQIWCNHLEHTLLRAAGTRAIQEFQALKINPLAPLREIAFRPIYTHHETAAGAVYAQALDRVEQAWNVAGMRPVGSAV